MPIVLQRVTNNLHITSWSYKNQKATCSNIETVQLLGLSWQWLRKWDVSHTPNMFPALPPGQDFQTYKGSVKNYTFFYFIDCFQRGFIIINPHFNCCVDKDWIKMCQNKYTMKSILPQFQLLELKPHLIRYNSNLQIFEVFQIFKSPSRNPLYTIVV